MLLLAQLVRGSPAVAGRESDPLPSVPGSPLGVRREFANASGNRSTHVANSPSLVDHKHVFLEFILSKGYPVAAVIETLLNEAQQASGCAYGASRGYVTEHASVELTFNGHPSGGIAFAERANLVARAPERLAYVEGPNASILQILSALLLAWEEPALILGDWQDTPKQLGASGWYNAAGVTMVVSTGTGDTCSAGRGRALDFGAANKSCVGLIGSISAEHAVPWATHAGLDVVFRDPLDLVYVRVPRLPVQPPKTSYLQECSWGEAARLLRRGFPGRRAVTERVAARAATRSGQLGSVSLALAQEDIARVFAEFTSRCVTQSAARRGVDHVLLHTPVGRGFPCVFEWKSKHPGESSGNEAQGLGKEVREARSSLGLWSSFLNLVRRGASSDCVRRIGHDVVKILQLLEGSGDLYDFHEGDNGCPPIRTGWQFRARIHLGAQGGLPCHAFSCIPLQVKFATDVWCKLSYLSFSVWVTSSLAKGGSALHAFANCSDAQGFRTIGGDPEVQMVQRRAYWGNIWGGSGRLPDEGLETIHFARQNAMLCNAEELPVPSLRARSPLPWPASVLRAQAPLPCSVGPFPNCARMQYGLDALTDALDRVSETATAPPHASPSCLHAYPLLQANTPLPDIWISSALVQAHQLSLSA